MNQAQFLVLLEEHRKLHAITKLNQYDYDYGLAIGITVAYAIDHYTQTYQKSAELAHEHMCDSIIKALDYLLHYTDKIYHTFSPDFIEDTYLQLQSYLDSPHTLLDNLRRMVCLSMNIHNTPSNFEIIWPIIWKTIHQLGIHYEFISFYIEHQRQKAQAHHYDVEAYLTNIYDVWHNHAKIM